MNDFVIFFWIFFYYTLNIFWTFIKTQIVLNINCFLISDRKHFYKFIFLISMLDIALIFLYYNWNIFSTVFSSVWVILSKNFQIVFDLFGWISRWTLLVCKLQEYVTFAFVWAELTEVTSREKKNGFYGVADGRFINECERFPIFVLWIFCWHRRGKFDRSAERAFWNQSMASISTSINHLHGNWYERLAESFSL